MKKRFLGWAVIFAVTTLLTACASHEEQASQYIKLSGADATMAQTGDLEQALAYMDDTILYAATVTDESEAREQDLASQYETFTYAPPYGRGEPLYQEEIDLEWQQDDLAVAQAYLKERESQLDLREQDLEWREDTLATSWVWLDQQTERLAQQDMSGSGTAQLASIEATPVNAEPGRCYAQVLVPGEYLTFTDKRLIKPTETKVETIPARYETVSEQVLVEPASVQTRVIPAKFNYVMDWVMVEPEKRRLVHVPAQYETVLEQELVAPATTTWKKGFGPIQRVDEATGEILCLVETPAQYRTVAKSVLKTPATSREVVDPAVYESFRRKEIITPERVETVNIPAKYKTVLVTKMVEPAKEKLVAVPALYQTVTKRVKVTDDRMDWQEILCESNMTEAKVSDIQRALSQAGFNPGPIDGVIGEQTMAAVNAFQKAHNLTVTKHLTLDTLVTLGPGL